MLHVVLVEDSDDQAAETTRVLSRMAHVTHRRTDAEALDLLAHVLPDALITDLRGVAPGGSPIDYVVSLRVALDRSADRARQRRRVPIILASAIDPIAQRGIASTLIHTHALPKPYSPRELRELLDTVTGGIQ